MLRLSGNKIEIMKKLLITSSLLIALLLQIGCSVDVIDPPKCKTDFNLPSGSITSSSTKTFDEELLKKFFEAVYKESQSDFCQRGDIWGIAAVGAKPCGGPASYIAYKKYNEECFLKLLALYSQQAKLYTAKYQQNSDCAVVPVPATVDCREGKPVLVY